MIMSLQIGTEQITSDRTKHRAMLADDKSWTVTWLGARGLRYNQAITAMTIAEHVLTGSSAPGWNESAEGRAWWGHLDNWCKELGVKSAYAITQTWTDPGTERHVGPGTCPAWCVTNHTALMVHNMPEHGYMTTHRSAPVREPLFGTSRVVVMQSPGRPPVVALVTGSRASHVELDAEQATGLAQFLTDRNGGDPGQIAEEIHDAVMMSQQTTP